MKQWTTFNYPEIVGNHFLYQHSINDHNNKLHSPISLEVAWAMKYWPNCVFAFLLSIMEVNVNLAATYFCGQEQMSQIDFHKLLAKTLICNNHCNEEINETLDKKHRSGRLAIVSSSSPYKKFGNVDHCCKQCISSTQVYDLQKRVCTYCLCSPGVYQCAECFGYQLTCSKNNLSNPS